MPPSANQPFSAFRRILAKDQVEVAIAEERQGVELAPNDPRPHLALGLALVRAGQKQEAKRELETAIELAKKDPRVQNHEVRAQQELERLDRS